MPVTQRFINVGDNSSAQPLVPVSVSADQSKQIQNLSGSSLGVLQNGIDGGPTATLTAGQSLTTTASVWLQSQGITSVLVTTTSGLSPDVVVERGAQGTITATMLASTYGAKGDGVLLYNAAMTAGSAVLNSTDAGVNFTSADVGKTIIVSGVAASNEALVTTILSVQSTSQITLNATAAVSSPDPAGARIAVYGTDDTAAIQAASDAAATFNSGTVEFDSKIYMICGALQQGGARKCNSQLTLPNGGATGNIGRLVWRGARDFSGACGNMPFPGAGGTVLMSTLIGATYTGTYGIPSVVGGPTQEQQSGYSAWLHVMEDLCVLTPRNPTLTAFNHERTSSVNRRHVTAGTLEWGFFTTLFETIGGVKPSHPWACGFIDPLGSNFQGGGGRGDQISTWGYVVGIAPAEHSNVSQYQVFNTYVPIGIRNPFVHAAKFNYITCQTNPYVISGWDPTQATVAAAIVPVPAPAAQPGNVVLIDELDLEDYSDTTLGNFAWTAIVNHINDANNRLNGYVRYTRWTYAAGSGTFTYAPNLVVSGAASVMVQPNNPSAPVLGLGQAAIDALMPWTIACVPLLAGSDEYVVQGTWAGFATASADLGAYIFNSTNAQNDEIGFYFPLGNGSWTISLLYHTTASGGIIAVNLDGVSQGTVDTYQASATFNVTSKLNFTVATAGKHLISFKMATKNASSVGFVLHLGMFQLRRTA